MKDGGPASGGADAGVPSITTFCPKALPLIDGGEELEAKIEKKGKDPRKIARKYQLDLCQKAVEENVIVYLGTGCGKTHIAVLLIHEFGNVIRKPQKKICVFLAPTVALVQQQARVIEDSTDFKVGTYCGKSKNLKNHKDWERELEQYEVLVMTPQILVRSLYHCFIKMDLIALLIFDECHHAQATSNHPYAEIMKVYYQNNILKLPRIFGMTASPVVGKDASDKANLPKSINSLENLLNAKVYSVEDKDELESFVASPVVKVYEYGPLSSDMSSSYIHYRVKLDEIKHQCISTLSQKIGDHQSIRNIKRLLLRMHVNILFCLENLGLWGALQASRLFLKGDHSERNELIEEEGNLADDSLCDKYLVQAADILASDFGKDGIQTELSCVEVLKEPFFSGKLLRLVGILSDFRLQRNMKCIVFVNRIVTARSLSYIIQNLKILASWKCHYLVGVHSGDRTMSRKTMKIIIEKFRTGELNLLVATKVGEEGLDIQTCCLVIRFDLPETVASFIQSRGRARMPQSEYAFLVNSGNQKELDLIKHFKKDESRMDSEITSRTSNETFPSLEESMYKVDSSGASVSAGYSISLLHHYCSKLPHDEYFDPKPKFYYFDDLGGSVCHISLPSNAPFPQITSDPKSSNEAAKKDACLKAIEELHKSGALSDYLLLQQDNVVEEDMVMADPDLDSFEDEDSRCQLQEMIVPAALKEPWADGENLVVLNCYFVKFIPYPEDRSYKEFGLFVKAPLPKEAEKMELELHLRRRRSVMTKFVQLGVTTFNKDEIMEAQLFQEMFLKVILDRSQFMSEFVPLGKDAFSMSSNSTFYLLLPMVLHDCEKKLTVDWTMIRRCLSSPIFKSPAEIIMNEIPPSDCLELANGCRSRTDVVNSLVHVPHKEEFCFVTDIVNEKNGYSPYKDSEAANFVEHFINRFKIHLKHPEQPLLRAKPLASLHNLLCNRKPEDAEAHELDEFFYDLPPELCHLKILGFPKDVGSSLYLLPSVMHRLENLLVAIELKTVLSTSFPEAAEVKADTVLEALTTEKCQERFSLERFEVLGDAFLKYAVARHLFLLHGALDEGELTRKRSNAVNNSNLFLLATRRNLQAYIRDQPFDPCQFFTFGRPCPIICSKETEEKIHLQDHSSQPDQPRCSRGHHWLHKKTIADVVEALVGAFLVDSGFKAATAFLQWIGIKVDFEASQVTHACIASKNYMPLASQVDVSVLEKSLEYQFVHRGLLLQAIIHPSYNKHGGGCYQRLEFLGDAVLDYLITSYLFSVYPKLKPGQLTDLRSASVNNKVFANVSVFRSFHKFLLSDSHGLSEDIEKYVDFVSSSSPESQSFKEPKCPKALGDLVESCLGAILLDTGFNLNRVWKIMLPLLDPVKSFSNMQLNPIRELRELCQAHKFEPQSSYSKSGGNFEVFLKLNIKGVPSEFSAINRNKKDALRIASQQLFGELKSQGYAPKSKTLEEVLKGINKMEPLLIGYDEKPIDVTIPDTTAFENMKLEEPSSNFKLRTHSNRKTNTSSLGSSHLGLPQSSQSEVVGRVPGNSLPDANCGIISPCTDESTKVTAKQRLYEICAANFWKPPVFECCAEEGPSHLRSFTYKVIVEIEEASNLTLECYGSSKSKKKAAADDAAEGALWYLKHEGYSR
ncbi:hypothetical protein SLE2022_186970 [Rubroshorea leprosula]